MIGKSTEPKRSLLAREYHKGEKGSLLPWDTTGTHHFMNLVARLLLYACAYDTHITACIHENAAPSRIPIDLKHQTDGSLREDIARSPINNFQRRREGTVAPKISSHDFMDSTPYSSNVALANNDLGNPLHCYQNHCPQIRETMHFFSKHLAAIFFSATRSYWTCTTFDSLNRQWKPRVWSLAVR